MRNAHRNFVGKSEGKITLVDLREVVWEGVDWMYLAQDRYQWRALVKAEINLRFP
jgi:hypothetical protein